MIKIIPNKPGPIKFKPRYVLSVTLGYGEHCDDTYTKNTLEIVESKKGMSYLDSWSYITRKEAEKVYTFFKNILDRKECDHIVLNDAWELNHKEKPTTFWYKDYMSDREIKKFAKFYEKYGSALFNPSVEHNWYGIVDIHIFYYNENGIRYDCEVVDE